MAGIQPWQDYTETGSRVDPKNPPYKIWDFRQFPFVVRWAISNNDRLTRWTSITRACSTMEEAVALYKRPFRGLSVDLVMHNGKPPGQHLDTLAQRKCRKPTKWSDQVPTELRAAA